MIFDKYRLCYSITSKVLGTSSNVLSPPKNAPLIKTLRSIMTNFEGLPDRFKGITVHSAKEPCESLAFPEKLERSLDNWKTNERRGIWFRVQLEHVDWVPVLAKKGFRFHHAKDDFVMMYLWLPKNEPNNVPPYAHTMIGVGGVVVNDKNQVLVISEKYLDRPHWKLPGGYVEPGENLVDAAIREVMEETNIKTEFESVISFRHGHNMMFNCSDIYMIVGLKPLSEVIQKCDKEISRSMWMDVDEYLNHPHVHDLNRLFMERYLEYKKLQIRIECKHGIHQILKKPYTVYSAVKDS